MLILGKSARRLQGVLLNAGLANTESTKSNLARNLGGAVLPQQTLKNIEEAFIEADLGYQCAKEIVERLARRKFNDPSSLSELQQYLRELITKKLIKCQVEQKTHEGRIAIYDGLLVIVLLGLNGSGKTSCAGKLAARFQRRGEKTLLAACDTFRAAAKEQLSIWARKAEVEIITAADASDPAALAFRALAKAREEQATKLIIDTAGRLDSDTNLMQQLAKMERALEKQKNSTLEKSQQQGRPGAKSEEGVKSKVGKEKIDIQFWLVLDATLGQNLKRQVKRFSEHVAIAGLIVTKLDSSAKAGALVALAQENNLESKLENNLANRLDNSLPIYFVTNGENIDDLSPFDARVFAEKLIDIDNPQTKDELNEE